MGIGDWRSWIGDLRLGMEIRNWGLELWDGDWNWRLSLKFVYRLMITLKLEVYFIICADVGLFEKYSQLNLTLFLDYFNCS